MFEVKPIAAALGAELHGVDLCTELQPEVYAEIRRLLIKHQVIFFRDQDISPQQHKALAESFGPVQTHPAYETVEGFPEITILESTAEKPSKIEMWHSDMTFRQHPPLGSVLRSKICPPTGGDTMWASMSAAYDGLSEGMQRFLSTLNAEHDFSYGFKESLAEPGGKLNYLFEHQARLDLTCRFKWTENAIAIWDNRSTQHKPINDYFPAHRLLERVAIDGDKPF